MKNRTASQFSDGAAGPVLTPGASWREMAECQYVDPDLWFPSDDDDSETARMQFAQACRVCRRCPVRPSCLSFALETGQQWGIWGGFSERKLRILRLSGVTAAQAIATEAAARMQAARRTADANDRRLASQRQQRSDAAARIEVEANAA